LSEWTRAPSAHCIDLAIYDDGVVTSGIFSIFNPFHGDRVLVMGFSMLDSLSELFVLVVTFSYSAGNAKSEFKQALSDSADSGCDNGLILVLKNVLFDVIEYL